MCMRHFVKCHHHGYRLSRHVAITVLHSGGLEFEISRVSANLSVIVVFPASSRVIFFFCNLSRRQHIFQRHPRVCIQSYHLIKWNYNTRTRFPMLSLEFFIDIIVPAALWHYGVDSASNRNEYQEYFLGVKAADA